VVGLVGPNGAGKTTLLLVLAGLLAPDAGVAEVGGFNPVSNNQDVHRKVGWMPDFFGVYDDLTLREYLVLFGEMFGLPADGARSRSAELLELVGLSEKADLKVHTLSRGQKQRLGFARALVQKPTVLLLDEPASGLDPRARIDLRDLVRRQAAEGACVVVSSHILQELEEMADLVVFVDAGRCTGVYPIGELPGGGGPRRWRLRVVDGAALQRACESTGTPYEIMRDGSIAVEVADESAIAELVTKLVAAGVPPTGIVPEREGLEGAFMQLGTGDR
jgi:ABC-2 type transport system ATP-binding protein